MFYLLSISLCCAVFFIVLASSSALCMWAGRLARPAASALAPSTAANLLFTIRILPVFLASLATFGFVLPALLKFEPRSTGELVGWPLLALAILGCAVLIVMSVRAARIIRSTKLVAANWGRRSKKLRLENIGRPSLLPGRHRHGFRTRGTGFSPAKDIRGTADRGRAHTG